jgi:CheY-like chemotaxis protein
MKYARRAFIGDDLSEAETAAQAIRMLEKYSPYDLVSLDHDLGGKIYCPSDGNSGYMVARHIAQMSFEKLPKRVIIHSFNPVGAENMQNVLSGIVRVIRQPFNLAV